MLMWLLYLSFIVRISKTWFLFQHRSAAGCCAPHLKRPRAKLCHCCGRPWRWCPSRWRGRKSRWPQTSPRWWSRSRRPCERFLTPPSRDGGEQHDKANCFMHSFIISYPSNQLRTVNECSALLKENLFETFNLFRREMSWLLRGGKKINQKIQTR